jgi:hypothetical protein
MAIGTTGLQRGTNADEVSMKIAPVLLAGMTIAAGAIIVLAFQRWVDFGIAETSGIDAEAATGISDGWVVVGLASAVLFFIGGIILRPGTGPILLPMTALGAVGILAVAGFDTVTNWHASGFHPENPGVLVQAQGDPTIVPYAIAALAILIAFSAAIIRGIELSEGGSRLNAQSSD